MHYAVLRLQALRDASRRFLPERWVTPPRSHWEGLHPKRASDAAMEVKPGAPASSWVAWEVSAGRRDGSRRRSRRGDG